MTRLARAARAVAAVAALAVCAACGGGADGVGGGSGTTSDSATTPAAGAFVVDEDFPDPDVVTLEDGSYLAFATGAGDLNIRVATSADLHAWTIERRDALHGLPRWASPGRTWAPDVSRAADGTWVMYFAAEHTDSGRQCVGVATSTTADGMYTPVGGDPLVCPVDEGGAIDPATFTDDDGKRYLLWKTDGNCCGLDTWIEIAPLSADGRTLAGKPVRLIKQSLAWEGALVEAPTLVRHGADYVLLYSANSYADDSYAVGAARSTSLLGPYTKQPDPVLASGAYLGPGGQDVVHTDHGDVLVFHAWDPSVTYRGLATLPLHWGPPATAG